MYICLCVRYSIIFRTLTITSDTDKKGVYKTIKEKKVLRDPVDSFYLVFVPLRDTKHHALCQIHVSRVIVMSYASDVLIHTTVC